MNTNEATHGYKAFYKGRTMDVYAPSKYAAQLQAAAKFRARKEWEVHVELCELNATPETPGQQVTHRPID
jgi:hypothetical protein